MNLSNLPTLRPDAIALLTGPSGSGKSQSLPALEERYGPGLKIAREYEPNGKPLIESFGGTPLENIRTLTHVGLGDPYTWIRTPDELSVGQRERLKLAGLLEQAPHVIIADEWLNTIDDTTAAAVAWRTGKELRRRGIGAIFATTREGLGQFLCPDVTIACNWTPDPTLTWKESTPAYCPLLDKITYRSGDIRDWHALKHLHYAAGDPATIHSYHVAVHPLVTGPAAIAILSYPDLHSAARNLSTDDRYKVGGRRETARRLSREVLKISRLVVTPELRTIGLAQWLIQQIVANVPCRYLECVTAMGPYTSFLQASGFREVPQTPSPIEAKLLDLAAQDTPPPIVTADPAALGQWVDTLSVRRRRAWRASAWHYYHQFCLHRRSGKKQPKRIAHASDPHWIDVWTLIAPRLEGRPAYFILGPIDPMTGIAGD